MKNTLNRYLKKQYIVIITAAVLFFFALSITAFAGYEELIPDVQVDELELLTDGKSFAELVGSIANGDKAETGGIAEKLISYFAGDIKKGLTYITAILGFAMMSACVKGAAVKLPSENGDTAFLIIYCVIAAFLLGILKTAVGIASDAAEKIIAFVKMSIPAYIGIVSATLPSGTGNLNGIFVLMVNVVSEFAGSFMLKVLFYIGVMYIINNMSTEIHILKLIELVRQFMFWILGFLLTVFAGMTGFSGIAVSAASKSGMNAVKYTVGHAVPLVGGFLADSAEIIYSSAVLLKSAIGTAGIIALFSICLIPVVKLFIMGMLLKTAAGLAEPFCDKRISDCTAAAGQTVIHIMICVILVCVMFIFTTAVILVAGTGG